MSSPIALSCECKKKPPDLFAPHCSLPAQDLLLAFPGATQAAIYRTRRIFINLLPTLVRGAPVVAGPHPGGVATVQVPGIIVTEDNVVVLVDKFFDDLVFACGPNLNDIVLVGEEPVHTALFGKAVGPQN